MKTYSQRLRNAAGFLVGLASMCAAIGLGATGADNQSGQSSFAAVTVNPSAGAGGGASDSEKVVISSIEPTSEDKRVADKDGAWLGVSVEESSEALASQLGLAPGAGLVVTYVAADSPAAKAGLEKNDVLVELDGQLLLVPAQLRKLIEVRKSGATIKLVFYRAGKKQETSAALLKTPARFDLFEKGHAWDGKPGSWWDVVGNVKIDTAKIQEGVRRSVEEARKAMQEALRASTNAVGPAAKVLRELERELQRSRINLDNNASVTVRSTSHRVKSIVKADESGTIVVVCNPKPRLTAHDKDGKLLFDGEIDTPEQRAKVPPELWEKVEPLLDKIAPKAEDEPETHSMGTAPLAPSAPAAAPAGSADL